MEKENTSHCPQPDRWSYLWLLIGTVLSVFLAGSWPLSLAGWLAPVFMIRFMRSQKLLPGFILASIGLGVANTIGFLHAGLGGISPLLFGALLGINYGVFYLVDRVLAPRLPQHGLASFCATLVFPTLMTAGEFIMLNKIFVGSSGSWAYSQQSNLILMQIISITGLWGLTFITTWFAATFNWAWERNFSWPEIQGGAAIYSSILLLVLVFGIVRLRFFEPEAGTVRVHGIIADEQTSEVLYGKFIPLLKTDREAYRREVVRNYDTYIDATIREARAGAKIVVWPENIVVGTREDLDALITRIGQVAKSENIYLVMGMVVLDSDIGEMRLAAFDPSGKMVIDHLKYAYNMKRDLAKVDLQTIETPHGRLAAVLCGDLDNPGVISQLGRKGVDILLVPAMEDADSAPWHHRLAAFRSVENGFSMVRVTMAGSSLVSDPYGRVLAAMDYSKASDRVMIAQVPTHGVHTIFDTIGNLFGWLNIAGFLVLAGWAIIRGRKASAEIVSSESQAPSV